MQSKLDQPINGSRFASESEWRGFARDAGRIRQQINAWDCTVRIFMVGESGVPGSTLITVKRFVMAAICI